MKVFVILALVSLTAAYPAQESSSKNDNSDVEFVPLGKQRPNQRPLPDFFDPFEGAGLNSDDSSEEGMPGYYNPFGGIYQGIEAMMRRMRNQLNQILNRMPNKDDPNGSDFPELHIPSIGDIDLGKGNTTSVTKIIDGHKVVINETEYNKSSENGNSFFVVRTIDVRPDGEITEREASSTKAPEVPDREVEPVENSYENEIAKNKEGYDNIETFDEVDNSNKRQQGEWNWDNVEAIETMNDNDIGQRNDQFRDLSNDIYVNQMMADAGAPTDPDAETFEVPPNVQSRNIWRKRR